MRVFSISKLHQEVMVQCSKSGYVSALHAQLLCLLEVNISYAAAWARGQRALAGLTKYGYLEKYSKQRGIVIFGLTKKGANFLTSLSIEAKPTTRVAHGASHVVHRVVADVLVLLLERVHALAGIETLTLNERQVLQGKAGIFKDAFAKVPDGLVIARENRRFIAIEVDTCKRKESDSNTLIKALKRMDEPVPFDPMDPYQPEAVLWLVPASGEGAWQLAKKKLKAAGFEEDLSASQEDQRFGHVHVGPSYVLMLVLTHFDFKRPYITWLPTLHAIAKHPYLALPV